MSLQSYKMHDDIYDVHFTANVNGDDRTSTIRIAFNVSDANSPTLAVAPHIFEAAEHHAITLQNKLQDKFSFPEPIADPVINNDNGHLELLVKFNDAGEYFRALPKIDQYLAAYTPEHYDVGNKTTHIPVEMVPDTITLTRFTDRIEQAERAAHRAKRVHPLDSYPEGLIATVFPTQQSIIDGRELEDWESDKQRIVVLIKSGNIPDGRSNMVHMASEIENRLTARHLGPIHSEVYLGRQENGTLDSGIIIIPAGDDPVATLTAVNDVLAHVQEHADVLQQKLGRRVAARVPSAFAVG